jgi:hypothetical protein
MRFERPRQISSRLKTGVWITQNFGGYVLKTGLRELDIRTSDRWNLF